MLEFILFDKLDLFDDESDDDGSVSGSPGMCAFPFCSGKFVGGFSGVGYGVFVPTGIESIGDVFPLVVFVSIGVEYKGGRLIYCFGAQNLDFPPNLKIGFSIIVLL